MEKEHIHGNFYIPLYGLWKYLLTEPKMSKNMAIVFIFLLLWI